MQLVYSVVSLFNIIVLLSYCNDAKILRFEFIFWKTFSRAVKNSPDINTDRRSTFYVANKIGLVFPRGVFRFKSPLGAILHFTLSKKISKLL